MIKMLPDFIANDVKSQAEVKLFQEFKSFQIEQKYIIIHSLGVSEHINNIFGEIDFVIICSKGVLCVEVKGGDVSCSNGVWQFVNRYGKRDTKTVGPFQQVQGNMHSLRRYLSQKLGANDPLVSCQYASCVIMPDCRFTYRGIEIIPEILFDKSNYSGLKEMIDDSFDYWTGQLKNKHGFSGSELSDKEMDRLAMLLRGDFHFVPSMKETVDEIAGALCNLTREQYHILKSLDDNVRTLVSGMAGSGKTMLAMEQARRMCLTGHKVKYICFNRNVAEFVKCAFENESIEIDVSTLHNVMLQGNSPASDNQNYFENILPRQFLNSGLEYNYDYLVVDEGQDLFTELYLDCLERLLKGGLKEGRWLMFYDRNQNLYNNTEHFAVALKTLKKYGPACFNLSINCRNTKQIADANILITGVGAVGKTKINGPKVRYISYEDKIEERRIIDDILISLRNEGVLGKDLVILSKYAYNNCKNCFYMHNISSNAGELKTFGRMWTANNHEVRLSTISGFKGLESKAVLLIDIDCFSESVQQNLNYVGISRATSLLYIIYDKSSEDDRQMMLANNSIKLFM